MNILQQLKQTNEPILVIYHANCPDGLVAALTIWLELGESEQIQYLSSQLGRSPPDVTGKHVFILDMSYNEEHLRNMISVAKSLLVIDHHKTNQLDLMGIPEQYKRFNTRESGATLTWQYFNPEKPLPLLYKYIRSRDIWIKDMPDTDAFHVAFDMASRDEEGRLNFAQASQYLNEFRLNELIIEGKALSKYQELLIKKALSTVCFAPIKMPDDRIVICAYINTTVISSDIGNRCMIEHPFVDFCACFSIDTVNQDTHFSLCSLDEREDVSVIAKHHGGGGHRNAAGCQIKGATCRLDYFHLDPNPIWCIFKGRPYRIYTEKLKDLTPEYIELLTRKFPGKNLQVELILN